jgi:hypothetical protein
VKDAAPEKPAAGVNTTLPSASRATVPLPASDTATSAGVSPSGSLSLARSVRSKMVSGSPALTTKPPSFSATGASLTEAKSSRTSFSALSPPCPSAAT